MILIAIVMATPRIPLVTVVMATYLNLVSSGRFCNDTAGVPRQRHFLI